MEAHNFAIILKIQSIIPDVSPSHLKCDWHNPIWNKNPNPNTFPLKPKTLNPYTQELE